jgi:TatA/E family protein of Tat protein translocase
MFGIGFQEMLIILVVVLIFFGPKRLPDLAKSMGKGIAEFRKASEEVKRGIDEAMKEEPPKEETPAAGTTAPQTAPDPPAEAKDSTTPSPQA